MFYYVNTTTGEQTYIEKEAWEWKNSGIMVEQWTLLYPSWQWVKTYL